MSSSLVSSWLSVTSRCCPTLRSDKFISSCEARNNTSIINDRRHPRLFSLSCSSLLCFAFAFLFLPSERDRRDIHGEREGCFFAKSFFQPATSYIYIITPLTIGRKGNDHNQSGVENPRSANRPTRRDASNINIPLSKFSRVKRQA